MAKNTTCSPEDINAALQLPAGSFMLGRVITTAAGQGGGDDASGITHEKLESLLALLQSGTMEEQMEFLFRLYDTKGSGSLNADSLKEMLQAGAKASSLELSTEAVEEAVAVVIEVMDTEHSGTISLDEFMAVMHKFPQLAQSMQGQLRSMVRKPAKDVSRNNVGGATSKPGAAGSGVWGKTKAVLMTYAVMPIVRVFTDPEEYAFQALMYLSLLGMCAWGLYDNWGGFAYETMGGTLRAAKMFAYVIRLAFAMLIITISLRFLTFLRETPLRFLIAFDKHIEVHKVLGVILVLASFWHSVCHFINYARATNGFSRDAYAAAGLPQPTIHDMYRKEVSITGLVLLGITLIACLWVVPWPDTWVGPNTRVGKLLRNFNYFWISHQVLWVSWVVLIMIHPYPGLPRVAHTNRTWIFISIPLAIYLVERLWRLYDRNFKRRREMEVVAAVALPGKTVQLIMRPRRGKLHFQPGQYVFVNCPEISFYQWHPFTVSSAPGDEFVTLHIRAVGGWTRGLLDLASKAQAVIDSVQVRQALGDAPHLQHAAGGLKPSAQQAGARTRSILTAPAGQGGPGGEWSLIGSMAAAPGAMQQPSLLVSARLRSVVRAAASTYGHVERLTSTALYVGLTRESMLLLRREAGLPDDEDEANALGMADIGHVAIQVSKANANINNNSVIGSTAGSVVAHSGPHASHLKRMRRRSSVLRAASVMSQVLLGAAGFEEPDATPAAAPVLPLPRIMLDGPYGAPTQSYEDYDVLVMVSAGIGVTPMASILRHVLNGLGSHRCTHCHKVSVPADYWLKKLYFYWSVREQASTYWFREVLQDVGLLDVAKLIDINIYYTGGKPDSLTGLLLELARTLRHERDGTCLISGLKLGTKTQFGRPNWSQVIARVAAAHPAARIGVLMCGPKAIANDLKAAIRASGHPSITLHKENF